MCPGGPSSTKASAQVKAKAAVVKVEKTARAIMMMKATAEPLRQDLNFKSKAELLVAGTPQEIHRKPRLSLAKTPTRFRMMLCVDDTIAARLPPFSPPSVDAHDLKKKQVTIGFDFAGIVGPCMALSMLGIPYTILWASESDESCRKMLRAHWQSRDGGEKMTIFDDATAMDIQSLPSPDIYIATPPCQTFSAAGNQQGTTDERGRLIYHPVRVVKMLKTPPKIVVIENVLALLQRHKPVYDTLVSELEEAGYTMLNKGNPVFDTKSHGVPHSRKRVILVGVHSPSAEGLVAWTPPKPLSRCPSLGLFVCGNGQAVPPKFNEQIERAWRTLVARSGPAGPKDMITDLGASERFQSTNQFFCPCLTASRTMTSSGYYIHSKKAFLSTRDKVRLMGYPVGCYHPAKANVTIGRFGHQLGNCVSGNVMMRLWPQILKAGNLLKARAQIRDTWAELVAFCEEFSLTVPVYPEPRLEKVVTTCRGGQTPGSGAGRATLSGPPLKRQKA